MKKKQIILATFNSAKVKEIQQIFSLDQFELHSLGEFPHAEPVIEDGETLVDNALKKAHTSFQSLGLLSMADDTGLEVDGLDGAPGVRSSRFAGEHANAQENNEKLLRLLKGIPFEKRTARFRTVVAFVDGGKDHFVEGVCEGIIHLEYRGQMGFGYDPLFFVPEEKKTFAEMTAQQKNRISHRGIAFRKMADWLTHSWISSL